MEPTELSGALLVLLDGANDQVEVSGAREFKAGEKIGIRAGIGGVKTDPEADAAVGMKNHMVHVAFKFKNALGCVSDALKFAEVGPFLSFVVTPA